MKGKSSLSSDYNCHPCNLAFKRVAVYYDRWMDAAAAKDTRPITARLARGAGAKKAKDRPFGAVKECTG